MPWVRLDDQFFANPKVVDLGKDAKLVYLAALTYCGSQLTDGVIRTGAVRMIAATVDADRACVGELIAAGLWEEIPEGYRIHDYLAYNPSGEQVKIDRANNAKRQQEWRERNRGEAGQFREAVTSDATNAPRNAVTNASRNTAPYPSRTPSPTHPTPERDVPPSSPPAPQRPDPSPPGGGGRKIHPVPRPSTLSRQQQARFDRWYPTYPNKQHRPEAERAWKKIDPDESMTDRLVEDILVRMQGRKWAEGYVELPATYLRNRVWEDDIEPVRAGPARASPNGQHQSNEQAKFTRSIAALQGVGGHRGPADIPEEHGETGRRALGRGHA